jgi:hypothetical protein
MFASVTHYLPLLPSTHSLLILSSFSHFYQDVAQVAIVMSDKKLQQLRVDRKMSYTEEYVKIHVGADGLRPEKVGLITLGVVHCMMCLCYQALTHSLFLYSFDPYLTIPYLLLPHISLPYLNSGLRSLRLRRR